MDEILLPEPEPFDFNEIEVSSEADNEILPETDVNVFLYEANHVGILPEPDAILSDRIVPLFGILAERNEREENCHFCLEKIRQSSAFIIQTPCCGHLAHADCFQGWAESSLNAATIRCAYCKAEYLPNERCFLCLLKLDDEDLKCTSCCHTKVHSDCVKELKDLITMLLFEHTIECGQLNKCHCLWVDV